MNEVIAARAPGFRPKVAVVLGSGLGGFAGEVKAIATIPYGELPGFPATGVSSRASSVIDPCGGTALTVSRTCSRSSGCR